MSVDLAHGVATRSILLMGNGTRDDFDTVVAPGAVNHEDAIEPPACRVGGPEGFYATALWLRGAFEGLTYEVHHVVAEDDVFVIDVTMSGRHTGPFAVHGPDGRVEHVWAPTGRSFAVRQSHWQRLVDGRVVEHWAVRDDLGQGMQLGWTPPSPLYLLRCALAKRRVQQAG